jgi:hypothetical protein
MLFQYIVVLIFCSVIVSEGKKKSLFWDRVMVFNATFKNVSVISWGSVLKMEEIGVPGEIQRPAASH